MQALLDWEPYWCRKQFYQMEKCNREFVPMQATLCLMLNIGVPRRKRKPSQFEHVRNFIYTFMEKFSIVTGHKALEIIFGNASSSMVAEDCHWKTFQRLKCFNFKIFLLCLLLHFYFLSTTIFNWIFPT